MRRPLRGPPGLTQSPLPCPLGSLSQVIVKTGYVSFLPFGLKSVSKDGGRIFFTEPTQTHTKTTAEFCTALKTIQPKLSRCLETKPKDIPSGAGSHPVPCL